MRPEQRFYRPFALVFGLIPALCGCLEPGSKSADRATMLPPDNVAVTAICPLGEPRHTDQFHHVPDTDRIRRTAYSLEHCPGDKVPLWVCERLAPDANRGSVPRTGSFKADENIATGRRAEPDDYKHEDPTNHAATGIYDIGHMAPADNYDHNEALMRETFILSNAAPQLGPKFNRGVWRALEARILEIVIKRETEVCVITGPIFNDGQNCHHRTRTMGANRVTVPDGFFKIVAIRNSNAPHGWIVNAFRLDHADHTKPARPPNWDFTQFARSVDQIEAETGLDFMPLLDSAAEAALERQVNALAPEFRG